MRDMLTLLPGEIGAKPGKTLRSVGIDLGTTNSAIAEMIWDENAPHPSAVRCLEVNQTTLEGNSTNLLVPSVVAIHQEQEFIGEGAKRLRAQASAYGMELYRNLFHDCKNDIGIERTYHRAPSGFRSATEIGGKVLSFLRAAAEFESDQSIDRTVVTVPASFQAAQRKATVEAAALAGLELKGGDLLDEPTAAFLDYFLTYAEQELLEISEPRNLMVFDFGGGTCDVAVFRIALSDSSKSLSVAPLSVSRYHRLGGGDIDTAIVHTVLIPQLMEQNQIAPFDLDYSQKKQEIEPSLLGTAETLKIGLCTRIARLQSFDQYENADRNSVVQVFPGVCVCKVGNRTLELRSPQLSAAQFETLLSPFLDKDLLFPRETEYRWICSIFAPLQDALDRSRLEAEQVDLCLMAGGSSLIPQIQEAVANFFTNARILTYPDYGSNQTSVARGAAYHAMALAAYGKGLICPICPDLLAIRTQEGIRELIPKGVALPYPPESDGLYAQMIGLSVPEPDASNATAIRLEIVDGEEERTLFREVWRIPGLVRAGEPLRMAYRLDENQVLNLKMALVNEQAEEWFEATIEHPLTHVVNPQSKRLRLYKLEEELRTNQIAPSERRQAFVHLACLYSDLGQDEKALELLKRTLRNAGRPDAGILNQMGICAGRIGDRNREETFYREAAAATIENYPLFNLTLAQKRNGLWVESVQTAEEALERERDAPMLVLRAMLAEVVETRDKRDALLKEAMAVFNPLSSLDSFALNWYITGARMSGDNQKVQQAQRELRTRDNTSPSDINDGTLPKSNMAE